MSLGLHVLGKLYFLCFLHNFMYGRHVCDAQAAHTILGSRGDSDEAIEMQDAPVTLLLDDCRQQMLATYLPACVWHRSWMGEGTQRQLSSCGAKLASWATQKLNSGLAG